MTARVLVCCDGTPAIRPTITTGRCRAFLPTRATLPDRARELAHAQGWTGGPGHDLCPACSREYRLHGEKR